jgi:hypothetical protein
VWLSVNIKTWKSLKSNIYKSFILWKLKHTLWYAVYMLWGYSLQSPHSNYHTYLRTYLCVASVLTVSWESAMRPQVIEDLVQEHTLVSWFVTVVSSCVCALHVHTHTYVRTCVYSPILGNWNMCTVICDLYNVRTYVCIHIYAYIHAYLCMYSTYIYIHIFTKEHTFV